MWLMLAWASASITRILLAAVVGQGLGEGQHEGRLANATLGVHDGDGVAHGLLNLVARTTTRSDRQEPKQGENVAN